MSTPQDPNSEGVAAAAAIVEKKRRFSIVWVVPLVAVAGKENDSSRAGLRDQIQKPSPFPWQITPALGAVRLSNDLYRRHDQPDVSGLPQDLLEPGPLLFAKHSFLAIKVGNVALLARRPGRITGLQG